jgi:multiple sugar transport system substrate-binding protein
MEGLKMKRRLVAFLIIVVLIAGLVPTTMAQGDKPFAGMKVVVVTQEGRSIGGPVEDYKSQWEDMTGGQVELQQFAFGDLFEKIVTSFETGAGSYDMLIFPADWAGDFMAPGYLEPISDELKAKVNWDDVIPLYRERIVAWGDTVYALPYDGDSHMLYYRKDLVDGGEYAADFEAEYGYPLAEPTSWQQYIDIAKFFNGKEVVLDVDGNKGPIFGVMEAQKRNAQSYWVFLSHAAGYGKVPGNPCFFFSCDDMTPQVNNPGWVRALTEYVDLGKYGDPNMINEDVADTRVLFPTGAAVFNIDWGDVGPISIDPEVSVIKGLVGFAPLPGGDQYWDYVKGEWVTPEMGYNRAPFIAFGGWIIGVAADSPVKEAALDFAAFMAAPDMVKKLAVTGGTGVNPCRYSQFEDVDSWVQAGFDEASAKDYLDAILTGINDPNAVLDLRITGSAEYLQTLDVEIARAIAGEVSPQEALDNVAAQWNDITDRLGRDAQLAQYRAAVGYMGE